MITDTDLAALNIDSTLKWHDMNKSYDKFPHRNIITCTHAKLNTIKDGYSFNKCLKEGLHCASHAASVPPFT